GVQEAVPTGLVDLDERLDGGLWPAELSIVAARPGTGKTAFLLTVAQHVARDGKPVLFYSLEQSRRQLALRVVAAETGTNASLLRKGWLSQGEWEAIYKAVPEQSEVPLHVVDSPRLTVEQMLAYARVMQRRRGLALVLVDYLQIVEEPRVPGQSRAEQVGEISRKLKAMAMELDVPVLCAAQLNRRAEEAQRPTLADLRESGAIEQDADVVLFLWRDGQDESLVRCTIGKQRNGAIGEVSLVFLRHVQRFECVEMRRAEPA
ncbi:MAG TPA: DnaB-like helicase C-terminal domain-containing protein, partial [Limnochordales bacterium]